MNARVNNLLQKTMKRVLLGLLLLSTFQLCAIAQSNIEAPTKKDFKQLKWISGQWSRTNVREGQTANETWTKVSEYLYEGIGVSMKGSDTTFVEKLRIELKDNAIFYVADVRENASPTYFKITQLSETGFTSENPEHDFPKVIDYQLKHKTLTVIISDGDQKKMGFIFEKK